MCDYFFFFFFLTRLRLSSDLQFVFDQKTKTYIYILLIEVFAISALSNDKCMARGYEFLNVFVCEMTNKKSTTTHQLERFLKQNH